MSNVNIKLTNSIKFLREFYKDASKIYDECYDKMMEIDKIKEDEENYQNKLRKATVKFKEDMHDFIDEIDMDYDLFVRDFPEIKANKLDDAVIYSLRDFLEYSDMYKKLKKKKYEVLILKLESRMDVCSASKDYGKYIAYNKVHTIANILLSKVNYVKKRCDELTGQKNKDEE